MNRKNYSLLAEHMQKITQLSNISNIIGWDYATNMPPKAADSRGGEMATIAAVIHETFVSERTADLIGEAKLEMNSLDDWQKANLNLIENDYLKEKVIDKDLQIRSTIASNKCEFAWRQARAQNDFASLKPMLEEVVEITKEIALAKASLMNVQPYEALVDMYDPNRSIEEINQVCLALKNNLPNLINEISEKQKSESVIALKDKISIDLQTIICKDMILKMGLTQEESRLDQSTHPFCGGTSSDIRMTTRYNEHNFLTSLYGAIHEAGHGLYQANLPHEYIYQPIGRANGTSFHESQSLIMEMQAGTSKEFCNYLAKILKDNYGIKGPEYEADNIYKLLTRVNPSFIRVDADEATYPMHVIVRYEIEKALIEGDIKVADLPSIWADKMKHYLGIVPDSDQKGVLQDIHWPSGSFGYFPSYSLGAIIASMLMKQITNSSNAKHELEQGNFGSINKYLNENFRNYGSYLTSSDLLKKSTGEDKINPEIFLNYLKSKYLS